MSVTVRTFKSPADAQKFYDTSNPYNRDQLYNTYLTTGGFGNAPTGFNAPGVVDPIANGTVPPGTLKPAPSPGYDPAYGGKVLVPDPNQTAKDAAQGNLGNLKGWQDLADPLNAFNLGQVTNQYIAGVPNYLGKVAQSGANIDSWLKGQVPQDVKDVLAQEAAQRGVALGVPGSQFSNYDYLRSVGQTSLDLQKQGETALTGAIARMPRTNILDLSQYFVTPEQMQNAQYWANLLNASPVPSAANQNALNWSLIGQLLGNRVPQANYGGGGYSQPMRSTEPMPTRSTPSYLPVSTPTPPSSTAPGSGEAGGYAIQPAPIYDPTIDPNFDPFQVGTPTANPGWDYSVPLGSFGSPMDPNLGGVIDSGYDPSMDYWPGPY